MRNVLITGGAGFIGIHLAKHLRGKGDQVTIVDNFDRAVEDNELMSLTRDGSINLINGDLLDVESTNAIPRNFTHVFHLAAILGVDRVRKQPYDVLVRNSKLVESIISISSDMPALRRVLYASTSEVYAGTLRYFSMEVPTPETTPITISDIAEPRTSYMLSKIFGEAMLQYSGLPFTSFRVHNAYGPRMGMSHVIPQMLERAHNLRNGDDFPVFSPSHSRTFCYIDDIVELLYRFSLQESCENQTINCGNQQPEVTIKSLAETILRIVGKDARLRFLGDTAGSPHRRAPKMDKARELVDYQAHVSLEEGISKTYSWYRDNVFEGKGATAF